MSKETEAVLFYGILIPDDTPHDGVDVHVGMIGSDGDEIHYAFVPSGRYVADLDTCLRLPAVLTIDSTWEFALRLWCEHNNIAWPSDGAGWHLGPGRF